VFSSTKIIVIMYRLLTGKIKIYVLICPIDGHVKYIGVTSKKLSERLDGHMRMLGNNILKNNWIQNLIDNKMCPIIEEIDIVDYKEVEFWETHYISLYKFLGFTLLNIKVEKHRYKNRKVEDDIKRYIDIVNYSDINFGAKDSLF
jgi:hypothetical protein